MAKKVFISYHTYATIRDCRFRYRLQQDKVPPLKPFDARNAIYGFVTQRLFEHFYTKEWYKLGRGAAQKLYNELPGVMKEQLAKNVCLWEHRSEVEVLERDCQAAIPLFIQAVKKFGLIGERNLSERDIGYDISTQFRLTGRVDFLFYRKKELILLDGKGTKYDTRYLDNEQLLYYVLILTLAKERVPNRAGFWLWREGDIRWIDISKELVDDLYTKVKQALYLIQKNDVTPNPCSKSCRFCPYAGITCPTYQTWHRGNQDRLAQARQAKLDLPEADADGILKL